MTIKERKIYFYELFKDKDKVIIVRDISKELFLKLQTFMKLNQSQGISYFLSETALEVVVYIETNEDVLKNTQNIKTQLNTLAKTVKTLGNEIINLMEQLQGKF